MSKISWSKKATGLLIRVVVVTMLVFGLGRVDNLGPRKYDLSGLRWRDQLQTFHCVESATTEFNSGRC